MSSPASSQGSPSPTSKKKRVLKKRNSSKASPSLGPRAAPSPKVSSKGTRAARARTSASPGAVPDHLAAAPQPRGRARTASSSGKSLQQPRMSFGQGDLSDLKLRAEAARAALAMRRADELARRRASRIRGSIKRRSIALMDRGKWDPGEEARRLMDEAVAEEGSGSSSSDDDDEDDDDDDENDENGGSRAHTVRDELKVPSPAPEDRTGSFVEAKPAVRVPTAAVAAAAPPAAPSAETVEERRARWEAEQREIERLEAEEEAAEMAEMERLEREIEQEEERARREMEGAAEAERQARQREQYMLALREHLGVRPVEQLDEADVQAGVPVVFHVDAQRDDAPPEVAFDGTAHVSASFVSMPNGRRRSVVTMLLEPRDRLDPDAYGRREIAVTVDGGGAQNARVFLRPSDAVTPAASYELRHSRTDELVAGASMRLVRVVAAAAAAEGGEEEVDDVTAAHVRGENPFRVEGELPDGRYRAEFEADCFYASRHDLVSVANARRAGGAAQKVTMQPEITSPTEVVCVLRWAAHPRDLDLHAYDVDDPQGMHVYFSHKEAEGMRLDIDKTDGWGPETATLDVRPGRGFCVFVLNFSPRDGHVALSEAAVDVYWRGGSMRLEVPNDVSLPKARYWDVLRVYNPAKRSRADIRFETAGRVVPTQPEGDIK